MQQINDIQITNKYTFEKLNKIFMNKKPTNKTVLLLRLYTEQNIDVSEMHVLVQNEVANKRKGKDFTKENFTEPKPKSHLLFKNIAQLDVYKDNHVKLIDKLKE